jgi:hypothetical protein
MLRFILLEITCIPYCCESFNRRLQGIQMRCQDGELIVKVNSVTGHTSTVPNAGGEELHSLSWLEMFLAFMEQGSIAVFISTHH